MKPLKKWLANIKNGAQFITSVYSAPKNQYAGLDGYRDCAASNVGKILHRYRT